MKSFFIKNEDFGDFLEKLVSEKNVYGPIAKQNRFVFEKLSDAKELRLDYDVVALPPKKEIFPTRQELVRFDGNKFEASLNPVEKILFGVHPYDVKGIDQLDHLFTDGHEDVNWTANRKAVTIVASNVQNVSPFAFFGTVGKEVAPKGHDAFLTKLEDGYVFEVFTEKGEKLVKQSFWSKLLGLGTIAQATSDQVSKAQQVKKEADEKCKYKLKGTSSQISEKVRAKFEDNAFWEEQAKKCFSCGSCNTVCPTCYCFNVEDKWNVDQKSGARTRTWDACLTVDFSKISLGGGHHENFRETRGSRFRHRIMRKATYLNPKLGGPACIGCGRCSSACTSNIANPVEVINKIMES